MNQIPGQINIYMYFNVEQTKKKRGRKKKKNLSHIRDAWEVYGISKSRYYELRDYCRNPENAPVTAQEAHRASELLSRYIFMSVTENLSYDDLEAMWGRGEIERCPYGRTDFYGYRRYFYHLLDRRLRDTERRGL